MHLSRLEGHFGPQPSPQHGIKNFERFLFWSSGKKGTRSFSPPRFSKKGTRLFSTATYLAVDFAAMEIASRAIHRSLPEPPSKGIDSTRRSRESRVAATISEAPGVDGELTNQRDAGRHGLTNLGRDRQHKPALRRCTPPDLGSPRRFRSSLSARRRCTGARNRRA
jgi:hypothetical protein